MDIRSIGSAGPHVSVLGLGCNNFGGRLDRDQSRKVIHAALDAGVTHFDTADIYPRGAFGKSEEITGEALGSRRDKVVLATKFGMAAEGGGAKGGGTARYLTEACEASLRRLGTDRIDLFYLHRPDPETPIAETLRALDDLVRAGKVRHVGCSNFAGWQIADAAHIATELGAERFICSQEHYSLVAREVDREVVPALSHFDMGLVPFFPLASGLLTGKYRKGAPLPEGTRIASTKVHQDRFLTKRNLDLVEAYRRFAEERGKTLIDLAFSWLLARKPVASVIAGATSPEQVAANAAAIEWTLSADDLAAVDAIAREVG